LLKDQLSNINLIQILRIENMFCPFEMESFLTHSCWGQIQVRERNVFTFLIKLHLNGWNYFLVTVLYWLDEWKHNRILFSLFEKYLLVKRNQLTCSKQMLTYVMNIILVFLMFLQFFSSFFKNYYYAGWEYITAFAKVLTMYQIYHIWIHLLYCCPLFLLP
jgi:hypothetical protein